MSIESKHAYRFGYLKSDKWKAVRLEALVREKGKCQICGEESVFNDAHHIWYPEKVEDTEERHLVILCRPCHDFIHTMLPDCKTKDEQSGIDQWKKIKNAITVWRIEKAFLFKPECFKDVGTRSLGAAYDKLKRQMEELRKDANAASVLFNPDSPEEQSKEVMKIIKSWSKAYVESLKIPLDPSKSKDYNDKVV